MLTKSEFLGNFVYNKKSHRFQPRILHFTWRILSLAVHRLFVPYSCLIHILPINPLYFIFSYADPPLLTLSTLQPSLPQPALASRNPCSQSTGLNTAAIATLSLYSRQNMTSKARQISSCISFWRGTANVFQVSVIKFEYSQQSLFIIHAYPVIRDIWTIFIRKFVQFC